MREEPHGSVSLGPLSQHQFSEQPLHFAVSGIRTFHRLLCVENDGLYAAVWPLRLHLEPQHVFGPHLALGVQHAALHIPLHLHTVTLHR